MSTKQLIKCLTLTICLLPSITLFGSVKDILNKSKRTTCEHIGLDNATCGHSICRAVICSNVIAHQHQLITEVTQLSFAENLNDNQKVIVIDAGHGGTDPGTHGKHSQEKDIALKIALQLGKDLKSRTDDIKIIFTRETDIFIPLHERIGLANKKKADLFVSIHCNYVGNPKICGTETYVMGLHRAEDNLNVAKRENSAILLESEYEVNYEGYDPNSPVGHILLSAIQNVFIDNSIDLASKVENQFINRKKTKSRGVKQAGFVVLRQATMPSILVETGFLSNAKEEKYLLSKTGQSEMASGIGKGVLNYFSMHESTNSIVTQATKTEKTSTESIQDSDNAESTKISENGKYVIQIGVFSNRKNKKFESTLEKHGQLIIEPVDKVFKYSVGYFSSRNEASRALKALKKSGLKEGFVRQTS